MDKNSIDLFSSAELFETLSREEVERFGGGVPVKVFERGRSVYTPAYRGEIFFLLLRGHVRTYWIADGREITFTVIRAGEIFGEAAFTSRRNRGSYAGAMEDSEVALITRPVFQRLVERHPLVGLRAMELLSERLSFYEEKISDLGLKEVPSRLANLILDLAHREGVVTREGHRIPTHYTHEQLGTMIGAKRVAVTRALSELRKAGAVELRHRRILVKDLEALQRVAT